MQLLERMEKQLRIRLFPGALVGYCRAHPSLPEKRFRNFPSVPVTCWHRVLYLQRAKCTHQELDYETSQTSAIFLLADEIRLARNVSRSAVAQASGRVICSHSAPAG